jgi:sugar/nucleoside kinase (ribokinase family)
MTKREKEYVCIVGGANIDIQGFPSSKLILHDSNPGKVKISLGGVGRNIAENLVRLGVGTRLISAVGNDIYGNRILDEARNLGLYMEETLIIEGQSTSTYLSILNEAGDMEVAITLGQQGIFYHDGIDCGRITSPKIKVVNATGAGDAFVAALVYSHIKEFSIEYAGKFAMAASILTLSHENTINPNMSIGNVNNKMKELELC